MILELKGGLLIPAEAVVFAVELERRGFRLLKVGEEGLRVIPPDDGSDALTESDRLTIRSSKNHLLAIVEYCQVDH